MANLLRRDWSPVSLLVAANAGLVVVYIALIAVVMSYAALAVEFSNHVRNDEAAVATLEASYLDSLGTISATNPMNAGYAKPLAQIFVPGARQAALNDR